MGSCLFPLLGWGLGSLSCQRKAEIDPWSTPVAVWSPSCGPVVIPHGKSLLTVLHSGLGLPSAHSQWWKLALSGSDSPVLAI